jgi:hypothetical protein
VQSKRSRGNQREGGGEKISIHKFVW